MNPSFTLPEQLRGVLIQVTGSQLLLPNAVIAEVLTLAESEPVAEAPDWLLGRIRWRGWQVPLLAFSRLVRSGQPNPDLRGQRVLILKALGKNQNLPYFAILVQGFPRLVTVTPESLQDLGPAGEGIPARRALFAEEDIFIPDMDALEMRLLEALG